ncbi:Malonyl CoA-acyl carrier protein transacylase [Candidatus Ecksteinia adelgidicola]|nr:Malonyl CoA-acyl carrier protein transacylase [Candidatus Ecksteinia adelgidicola]
MTQFAFIFPGQGSQSLGMLAQLGAKFSIVKETFHEASSLLGYNLWKLVQTGPVNILNKTQYTQPALLTSSVAIFRVWKQQGGKSPMLMAGHSLGEYSALVCSNVLDFKTAISLVESRGKLMQKSISIDDGAMYVIIGLKDEVIIQICRILSKKQIVSPVSFNAPGQVVIGGHKEAVNRAILACKDAGAKRVLQLPISVPSHCKLMIPAAHKFAIILNNVNFFTPTISVVNNVDVRIETNPNAIRHALIRQFYNPVRWNESIKFIASQGMRLLFLEVGPGNILSGLTKRILNILPLMAVNDPISLSIALKNQ